MAQIFLITIPAKGKGTVARHKDRNAARSVARSATGSTVVHIVEDQEELATFGMKTLLEIFNAIDDAGTKRFSSLAVGVKRTWKAIFDAATAGKAPEKKSTDAATPAPRKKTKTEKKKGTKIARLRALLVSKKRITMDEAVSKTGYNRQNVLVALSILKNRERTTDPIVTKFDRATGIIVVE